MEATGPFIPIIVNQYLGCNWWVFVTLATGLAPATPANRAWFGRALKLEYT